MNETVALVATGGALIAAGTVLLLSRPLTRIVLGAVVLGNGVNLLLLATSGAASRAPLLYRVLGPRRISDPLPQAFVLTAIVITLALTAFLSAMAYRAWQLSGTDDVQDDVEDLRVAHRAEYGEEHGEDADARRPFRERRERRARRRELMLGTGDEARRAARRTGGERSGGEGRGGAPARMRGAGTHFHEARRRARAETRSHHARGVRTEEEPADEDMWDTILGADR
ncbi:Na(+)/H(+) antiporter subunit C [Streptomyces sp. HNM0575]|uniref:Na(+)/H(+) antiporter subunit C n=1 Tax=Streptomyces sp. HNM0575 TaxID=2716338 RepID=UPI00145C9BDB|nr:Na(+)/H(+) antiporter subunit C [Streptomyces sp. HNM0575]NLU76641.1 Na(+)/H(+) antiporter subunit C [Streptomyces sp. HNM0575]